MRAILWIRIIICCTLVVGFSTPSPILAQSSSTVDCSQPFEKRGFKKHVGLFNVYSKSNDEIFIEIGKNDFAREYIFANYVDRGAGPIVGEYADPILIKFQKNGSVIEIVQTNSSVFFDDVEPLRRTRQLTMSNTVLASLKLHECSSDDLFLAQLNQDALSKLSKNFFTEIGRQLSGGQFAWGKSSLKDWQVFSDNMSFISEHKASSGRRLAGVANGTNFTMRVRHILLSRSEPDFIPRLADTRVGYFDVGRRNLGNIDQTKITTYIQRWRLEKKDPRVEISEPIKPIVFWIENTTPTKLKPYIRQGVLAWNEAFRSAGFSNAIEVYDQPENAPWEAGDISKNVIRWQASVDSRGLLGYGPSVYDPITGEILGADILLTFASIGNYVDDWERLANGSSPLAQGNLVSREVSVNKNYGEQLSNKVTNGIQNGDNAPFSNLSELYRFAEIVEKSRNNETSAPSLNSKIRSENSLSDVLPEPVLINNSQNEALPITEEIGFADRMIKEVIVDLVMHEVGHTLGLTHNFRGSRWRSIDEIFDREITKGSISASVMDYLPINLSPIDFEQGDFANTHIGPYDIWAIEFGYNPTLSDPDIGEPTRTALLRRAGEPGLLFGGDEVLNDDPFTLPEDLTVDPIDYAASRLGLITTATAKAAESNNFNSGREYLGLYNELSRQILFATNAIISQVNPYTIGAYESKEVASEAIPTLRINSKENQKEAIDALGKLIFAPNSYEFSQDFLFRMGANSFTVDKFTQERMRTKSMVLRSLTDQQLLLRMHHSSVYGGEYSPTEMLFDLKSAVIGDDLSPLAIPGKDRRDQQILFANTLVDLINSSQNTRTRRGYLQLRNTEQSIVSAAARPVLSEMDRELLFRNPWLPMEIRGHRQELRSILKSAN